VFGAINGLVALPFHGNQFVEGWQISGLLGQNTGLPFSPYTGTDIIGWAGSNNNRPNYVAGCQVQVEMPNKWFDPNCYTLPAAGTLGNAGRDTIIGPGIVQVDLAVFKDTKVPKISEAFRIQFRAEAYNLFNHPAFGLPGNSMFTSAAGARNTAAGVITTLAGNATARQLQFGLKFLF